MYFLPANYFPHKIISLRIEHITIPIGMFSNLKSLWIVHGNEWEEECLNMVKQVRQNINK
jgi:hypothetical protein